MNISIIIDLNYLEETSPGPEVIVGTLPKSEKIVFLQVSNMIDYTSSGPSPFSAHIRLTQDSILTIWRKCWI